MATYELAAGQHGAYAKTLAPGVVDTVTFDDDLRCVEVLSDGSAAVYVTVDGSMPAVGASHTWEIPAGGIVMRTISVPDVSGATVIVRLVSAGTVKYSVAGCDL